MDDFQVDSLPASSWAGPSKRRRLLSNGNIYEVTPVSYGPELLAYMEETTLSDVCMNALTHRNAYTGCTNCPYSCTDVDDASCAEQILSSYMTDSRTTVPILLTPPSHILSGWTVTLAKTTEIPPPPKQIFLVHSSVPYARALDKLCRNMAHLSVTTDDTIPHSPRPASSEPEDLDNVIRRFEALSIERSLVVKQTRTYPSFRETDRPPYSPSASSHFSDEETVYDGSSDSTYAEDDHPAYWPAVYKHPIVHLKLPKTKAISHGSSSRSGCLPLDNQAEDLDLSHIAYGSLPTGPYDAASIVVSVGLHPWRSTTFSSPPPFIPALFRSLAYQETD